MGFSLVPDNSRADRIIDGKRAGRFALRVFRREIEIRRCSVESRVFLNIFPVTRLVLLRWGRLPPVFKRRKEERGEGMRRTKRTT